MKLTAHPRLRATLARSTTQGLTLIECLVAIIMVALISSAIAPALVISVATRVQSQKAEQALTLAQSQIDQIRMLAEQDNLPYVDEPDITKTDGKPTFVPKVAVATLEDGKVESQPGPSAGIPKARKDITSANDTFREELNGNEFAVQIYRTHDLTSSRTRGSVTATEPVAFALGVRVYDLQAVQTSGAGTLSNVPIPLGVVGGSGQRGQRPLAALYTTVALSEQGDSFCDLIRFTNSTAGSTTSALPLGCL
jgi:prepilin-type N-terminal cleavage/methylation domain-containing protein